MNIKNVLKEIKLRKQRNKNFYNFLNKNSSYDFYNIPKTISTSLSQNKLPKDIKKKSNLLKTSSSFDKNYFGINSTYHVKKIQNKFNLNKFINKPDEENENEKERKNKKQFKGNSLDIKHEIKLNPFEIEFKEENKIDFKRLKNDIRKKDDLNLNVFSLFKDIKNKKINKIKSQNNLISKKPEFEINLNKINKKNSIKQKRYSIIMGEREVLLLHSFNNQICSDMSSNSNNKKASFIDCYFPPTNSSICPLNLNHEINVPFHNIYWLRIQEIFQNSKISIYDNLNDKILCPNQGWIKNSNLISSLIMISKINFEILKKLLINIQINENGQFSIAINYKGTPTLIIIDDYFPCLKGTRFPLFAKSPSNNIWPMIIEKAFAKIYGSYFNLQKISCQEILEMLIIYKVDNILIKLNYDYLWNNILYNSKNNKRGMIGIINNNKINESEFGLLNNSCYCIINAYDEIIDGKNYKLLKLKYPISNIKRFVNLFLTSPNGENFINEIPLNSCNNYNWKGKFSFESTDWNKELIKKINYQLSDKDMGYFYMCYDDFFQIFTSINIVDFIIPLYSYSIFLQSENTLFFIFLERETTILISCYGNDTFFMKLNFDYSIEILDINNKWINNIKLNPGIYIIYCIIKNIGSYVTFGSECFFNYKIEYPNQIISNLFRSVICDYIIYNKSFITKYIENFNFHCDKDINIYKGFFSHLNLGFIFLENHKNKSYKLNINIFLEGYCSMEKNDYSIIYVNQNQKLSLFFYKIKKENKKNINIDIINKTFFPENAKNFLPNIEFLNNHLKSIKKPNSNSFNNIIK